MRMGGVVHCAIGCEHVPFPNSNDTIFSVHATVNICSPMFTFLYSYLKRQQQPVSSMYYFAFAFEKRPRNKYQYVCCLI